MSVAGAGKEGAGVKVRLLAHGALCACFGPGPQELGLRDNAAVPELLGAIADRWGTTLPPGVWDAGRGKFAPGVLMLVGRRPVRDRAQRLEDGQDIDLYQMAAGG
jgi:hypothetical protein